MNDGAGVGRLLRWLRVNEGLTQWQAAELAGVSQPTWSRWEGGHGELTLSDARRICERFEINPLAFLPAVGFPLPGAPAAPTLGEWADQRRMRWSRPEHRHNLAGTENGNPPNHRGSPDDPTDPPSIPVPNAGWRRSLLAAPALSF